MRLAEITGAIAIAADAGIGYPPETALRTCLVAVALARAMALDEEEIRDAYHAALLRHAGCTASAHEETVMAGDEIDLRSTLALADAGKPADMVPRIVRGLARKKPLLQRARTVGTMLARAPSVIPDMLRGRCEVAVRFAVRLGLGPRVEPALDEAFERWDGKGLPHGKKGDATSRAARLVALAEVAASYFAVGGVEAARAIVKARRGAQLDPALAACFVRDADAVLEGARGSSLWDRVLDVEPLPVARVASSKLRVIAELLADFADMKSTWTLGHSRGVAERVRRGADAMGARDDERAHAEIAALVHDLGRVAISNALWDKPGPLGRTELEEVRTHAFHTDRILRTIGGAFGELADVASAAHERVDGSGYHRRLGAGSLSRWVRLVAAADVAQAMSEARPHRAALAEADAERTLRQLASEGALCARAVDAVLGAPAQKKARAAFPAGLSEREIEVLRLVARGLTDKEVAATLGISHRTVHHHNKHAYDKIGVSTRAAAALFLVENDLLDA